MRVRLSYSVELEEVPAKVANILAEDIAVLPALTSELESLINRLTDDEPNASKITQRIDEMRVKLGVIDNRLSECSSILQGYSDALNPPVQENPEPIPTPSEEPTT
tara:strand:+ start:588 stop:905 length:318 start_codon:yes stop_codon:yes gene_type:complete